MSEPIDIDEGRRLLAAIEGPCTCDSGIGCFYHDAKADLSIWFANNAAALLDATERVKKLEEALQPFADVWHGNSDGTGISFADCKRAADLLDREGRRDE